MRRFPRALTLFFMGLAGLSSGLMAQFEFTDRAGRAIGAYGKSHALVIGASQYRNGWSPLHSVPAEVAEVMKALRRQGFEAESVMDPDAEALERAFTSFMNRHGFGEQNRLLIFFSGHGHSRANNTKGYLVPVDAPDPKKDRQGFLTKALPMTQIRAWALEMEAKHVLFVFDSCFSGTIFKTRSQNEAPPHITDLTNQPARQFITAGSAGQKVPAKSVFTPLFVRALSGAGDTSGDGYALGSELGRFLHEQVLAARKGQTPQSGYINDPDFQRGDFVFKVGNVAGPPNIPEVSLDDLRRNAEIRGQWRSFQEGMRRTYDDAQELDASADLEATDKAEAWSRFLTAYGRDNPFSESDEQLRQQARERLDHWQISEGQASRGRGEVASGLDCEPPDDCEKLGDKYYSGNGVEQSYEKAFSLYERACDGGLARGCTDLGYLHEKGLGTKKDPKKAKDLYTQGCDGGNAAGCSNLGVLYRNGVGTEKNLEEAARLYKQACDGGNAIGCSNLGTLHRDGLGVEKNLLEAAKLSKQGCDNGAPRGCTDLGYLYENGLGIEKNFEEAAKLYRQACDGGNAAGCSNLGVLHRDGLGVEKNFMEAAKLSKQGCDSGHTGGCTGLGYLLERGLGVERNLKEAAKLYRQGCDGGFAIGCSNLGTFYRYGKGLEIDKPRAADLYKQACDGGFEDACGYLEKFCKEGSFPAC